MESFEAIYDNGKFMILGDTLKLKAKVKVTIIEEFRQNQRNIAFPKKKLGKVKNIKRQSIYEDYLSD
jgi:hypothetical protein